LLADDAGLADVAGRCCWQNGAAPEIERIVTLLDQVRAFARSSCGDVRPTAVAIGQIDEIEGK
jgi:hypothetical protein